MAASPPSPTYYACPKKIRRGRNWKEWNWNFGKENGMEISIPGFQ